MFDDVCHYFIQNMQLAAPIWKRILIAALVMLARPALADIMTLTNQNSTVHVDPTSQTGVYDWVIDGKNVLYQQWFWVRAGAQTNETPVGSNLALLTEFASGGHGALVYSGQDYSVTIRFSLLGGATGSNAADLSEVVQIKNTGRAILPIDFFQYANIQFSSGNDAVQFLPPHSVQQTGGGIFLNETTASTTGLVHHQAGVYANILNSLNDNSITTLNDSNFAAGDAAWAFQWEQRLAPGQTFTINTDMNVVDPPVPEPESILLLGTVLGAIFLLSRRRIRSVLNDI